MPIAFATAWYSLAQRASVQKGQTVLIHNGASAVGQAAIVVAQHLSADVFVTVSSAEEQAVVEKYGVQKDRIMNAFAKGIMRLTNGQGVDVVLNSVRGEALRQTWHCVASFGHFIELGQEDILGNTGLDMAPFKHNITFIGVNMVELCRKGEKLAAALFDSVWQLFRQGQIKPPSTVSTFRYSQLEDAFTAAKVSSQIGKVVVVVDEDEEVMVMTLSQWLKIK